MSHRITKTATACLLWLAVPTSINAEVLVSTVISENAVLQRDAAVPIWGRADPREKVRVTFWGQTKETTADRFGRWRLALDPMPASTEGRLLVVDGEANRIRVQGVRVGDVWLYLCMSFHLNEKSPLRAGEPDPETLPPISFCRRSDIFEQRTHSRRPQEEFYKGGSHRWVTYRAPGKYFARDAWYLGMGLGRETGVPVGTLGLGASTLESMTPPAGFQLYREQLGADAKTVATWAPDTPEGKTAYLGSIEQIRNWILRTRSALQRKDVTFRDLNQPPLLPGPPLFERAATTHYNNVIHRFLPAAVRGIIIQPNENSVGDSAYEVKARALIAGLRQVMGRNDVPVCFVQMHSPDRYERNAAKDQSHWVELRDAQARLAGVPNTTVVATYDLDPDQRDALPIDRALRASQWALAVVRDAQVKTGPVVKKHRRDGKRIVVEFHNVGGGLMVGVKKPVKLPEPAPTDELGGFQLSGPDGQWHGAAASIEGDTVVVTCNAVVEPLAVRYAWSPWPTDANLYNRDGFPALPFKRP